MQLGILRELSTHPLRNPAYLIDLFDFIPLRKESETRKKIYHRSRAMGRKIKIKKGRVCNVLIFMFSFPQRP